MNGDVEQLVKKSNSTKSQKKVKVKASPKENINIVNNNSVEALEEKCDEHSTNIFLANIIYAFHVAVIIFILLAPFSNIPAFLILHVTFSFSLLLHWYNNQFRYCICNARAPKPVQLLRDYNADNAMLAVGEDDCLKR